MSAPLSERMLWAAHVLDELNRRYDLRPKAAWTAADLRRESPVVQSEEQEQQ